MLEHVRRLAQSGFGAHLRFTEAYDPSLPPVLGNRDQLGAGAAEPGEERGEAVTVADMDGEITLTTAYRHGVRLTVPGSTHRVHLPLVVTVRDNGPGIGEDIRPHLFKPS